MLTVTGEGVWVSGERADIHALTPDSTTLFFKPEGSAGGTSRRSWCVRPPEGAAPCQHELPEAAAHAPPAAASHGLAVAASANA